MADTGDGGSRRQRRRQSQRVPDDDEEDYNPLQGGPTGRTIIWALGVLLVLAAVVMSAVALGLIVTHIRKVGSASTDSSSSDGGAMCINNDCDMCGETMQHVASVDISYSPLDTVPFIYVAYIDGPVPPSAQQPQRTYAYVPRANINTVACNTLVPTTPGTPPLMPTGFHIIDVTDPEAPFIVQFVQGLVNTSATNIAVITNVSTPFFTGSLLAVGYEACRAFAPHGIILYDVTDPTAPIQISEMFGDNSPFTPSSAVCSAANVFHRVSSLFGYVSGAKVYLSAIDICDQQIFFMPENDLFDITDPYGFGPQLIREWEGRDTSDLAWSVPVLPVPYDGVSPLPAWNSAQFYTNGTRPMVITQAGDAGWATIDLSDPFNFTLIAESSWPTGGDWFNPNQPSVGNAACIQLSPVNPQFSVASHSDTGFTTPNLVVMDGPNALALDLMVEHANNQLRISSIGNQRCGPTVFVGYACPGGAPFEPVPLESSLPTPANGERYIAVCARGPVSDPNYAAGACAYGDKQTSIAAAGYTAALYPNHHAGSQGPANSIDTLGNTGLGTAPFPFTLAFSTTHRAQMHIFNFTNDGDLLPYPLKNSSLYREPRVGQFGARICMFGSTFRGEHGYWHLLNSTTMGELAHWMNPDARWQQTAVEVTSGFSKSATGCAAFHDTEQVVAVSSSFEGVSLLRYGGARATNSHTFRLEELGRILPQRDTGGMYLIDPHMLYKRLSANTRASYVSLLEPKGKLHFYRIADCLLKETDA